MRDIGLYIIKRVLYFIPATIAITIIVFLILHLTTADPVTIMLGESATDESVATLREQMGLNKPLYLQYWGWFSGLFRGDMGNSLTLARGYPIASLIKARLHVTGFLSITAIAITLLIAFPAGTISALRRQKVEDYIATTSAVLGISMPDFWLGFMLVLVFSLTLGLFPTMGYVGFFENPLASFQHILLPAMAIAAPMGAVVTRILRSSLLDNLNKEHVLVAKAFGMPSRKVFIHYILKNSLIPTITVIGLQIRYLLGGVVVIEKVFSLPGLGSLLADAVFARDFFVVQSIAMVIVCIILSLNLIIDILYAFIDPRVKY
jgi:peptide/nickel transport system permease protein